MSTQENIIGILLVLFVPFFIIWICHKFDLDNSSYMPSECPVCLGDGRDEGWKTAWPCKACGGDGKYHSNEESDREISRGNAQREINNAKDTMPYAEYQKWLDNRINKK